MNPQLLGMSSCVSDWWQIIESADPGRLSRARNPEFPPSRPSRIPDQRGHVMATQPSVWNKLMPAHEQPALECLVDPTAPKVLQA